MIFSASNCARNATQTREGGSTSEGNSFAAATMRSKSAINEEHDAQLATCPRASSDKGEKPCCSIICSTSLHNMIHCSAGVNSAGLPHLVPTSQIQLQNFLSISKQKYRHIPVAS